MSYIGNSPTNIAFQTDTFSGTGSATAFTMSVAPANTTSVLVAVTGVLQDPSTYSVSGTTLTFSAAPPSGTNNISARYLGIPASGVTTTAYRTVTNTTATAGQTSFSIPSYTVGYIDVFRNGVYLPTTDYTATTGTTVVLTNAATVGDTITTSSFYVSSVLNAIPASPSSITSSYLSSGLTLTSPTLTSPIITGSAPQVTAYTSSSGTYTVPTNARYLQVRMVGGGGGGGGGSSAGNATAGTAGGATTFGTSLLTANGGSGGGFSGGGSGGAGGTATIGSGASGIALSGGIGTGNQSNAAATQYTSTSPGGQSALGGGAGGGPSNTTGTAGATNTGGGGSGGMTTTIVGAVSGAGGGAGGYIDAYITTLSATYSYAVGAAGTAGAGGTNGYAGGAGGSGVIYITAFF